MYCWPRFGPTFVSWLKRDPGHACDSGTEPERQRVDPFGAHTHGLRHGTVLRDGANLQAERRLASGPASSMPNTMSMNRTT